MSRIFKKGDKSINVARIDFEEIGGKAKSLSDSVLPEMELDSEKSQAALVVGGGYLDGFERGRAEGFQAGMRESHTSVNYIYNAAEGMKNHIQSIESRAESVVLRWVEMIMTEVCLCATPDSEKLISSIKSSLAEVGQASSKTITLNNEDLKAINESGLATGFKSASLVGSSLVMRGGYLIESEDTAVDARIERRIQSIIKVLRAG